MLFRSVILKDLNKRIRRKRVFISGAFSSSDTRIEEFSHSLSRNLTATLLENDYRIINGIGRRFGTHLVGYANEFLAKQGVRDIEKYLIIKPFVGNQKGSAKDKKKSREKVIKQCGAAIFVFGDDDNNALNAQSGVLEEFEIACKHHKVVIPVAYPGMISEKIWKNVKDNITQYPYLEKSIDLLKYEQPAEAISKLIVHILDSV